MQLATLYIISDSCDITAIRIFFLDHAQQQNSLTPDTGFVTRQSRITEAFGSCIALCSLQSCHSCRDCLSTCPKTCLTQRYTSTQTIAAWRQFPVKPPWSQSRELASSPSQPECTATQLISLYSNKAQLRRVVTMTWSPNHTCHNRHANSLTPGGERNQIQCRQQGGEFQSAATTE